MQAKELRNIIRRANMVKRAVGVTLTTGRKLGNVQAEGNRFYGADFRRGIIVYFSVGNVKSVQ